MSDATCTDVLQVHRAIGHDGKELAVKVSFSFLSWTPLPYLGQYSFLCQQDSDEAKHASCLVRGRAL